MELLLVDTAVALAALVDMAVVLVDMVVALVGMVVALAALVDTEVMFLTSKMFVHILLNSSFNSPQVVLLLEVTVAALVVTVVALEDTEVIFEQLI